MFISGDTSQEQGGSVNIPVEALGNWKPNCFNQFVLLCIFPRRAMAIERSMPGMPCPTHYQITECFSELQVTQSC